MPQTARTTARPRARFARTTPTPPPRRFPRSGTPQARGRRAAAPSPSGFGRLPGRKPKPQQKGIAAALTGLLSKGASSKPNLGAKSGKAGGVAALAAAAGVAFRNRDKLKAMLDRGRGEEREQPRSAPVQPQPVAPTQS